MRVLNQSNQFLHPQEIMRIKTQVGCYQLGVVVKI